MIKIFRLLLAIFGWLFLTSMIQANGATNEALAPGLSTKNERGAQKISGINATKSKLDKIHLEQVSFEHLTLKEVLRQLTIESQRLDPEKKGVAFLFATNDPIVTNMPNIFILALSDVRLSDVLDEIVLVADQKVRYQVLDDGSVMFFGQQPSPQLYSHVFRVDVDGLADIIKKAIPEDDWKAIASTNSFETLRNFISMAGVNFSEPPGKAIFYTERHGHLVVKATKSDLELIQKKFNELFQGIPAIHLKSRFFVVPKGTVASLGKFFTTTNPIEKVFTGIIYGTNNKAVVQSLESLPGIEELAEPEVTTYSGQRGQLRATSIQNLDPNYHERLPISGPASIEPLHDVVESGPYLDLAPHALPDGSTVNLAVRLSVIELLGVEEITNTPPSSTNAGVRLGKPKFLAKTREWEAAANVNLWDGQTVFIGGLPVVAMSRNGKPDTKSKIEEGKEMLVFITPTIVDAAGKPVHKNEDLPFAQTGIPPQPAQYK